MQIEKNIKWQIRKLLIDHYPKMIIDHQWPYMFGKKVDWDNPRDLNEKIMWLICYGDTSEWPRLADKYRVREYIKERGLEGLLIKLYGVWDDADKIDYEQLPEKFVLKCNHDSGSTIVVDKNAGYNKERINAILNEKLGRKFGYLGFSSHYNKIKPLIIAEELLEDHVNSTSGSLVDYKVWSFDGRVKSFLVCSNRTVDTLCLNSYDLDWNCHPEHSVFTKHYRDGEGNVPRPKCLNEMINAASILSKGIPQVRVDFYEVNGKLYFGELTLTSDGGAMAYYTEDYLIELGNEVVLPPKRFPIK